MSRKRHDLPLQHSLTRTRSEYYSQVFKTVNPAINKTVNTKDDFGKFEFTLTAKFRCFYRVFRISLSCHNRLEIMVQDDVCYYCGLIP